ncbi:hypothetical protein JOB18_036085 [Solea senegalensis]|uniref:Uncharacterized protein n=1 Tax=Solea senegalensis TaxID=28829 RepID=A0AAV6QJB4_SOLSE|nr:hypothetical protein JOB18_036085 [Solea senegalensis]
MYCGRAVPRHSGIGRDCCILQAGSNGRLDLRGHRHNTGIRRPRRRTRHSDGPRILRAGGPGNTRAGPGLRIPRRTGGHTAAATSAYCVAEDGPRLGGRTYAYWTRRADGAYLRGGRHILQADGADLRRPARRGDGAYCGGRPAYSRRRITRVGRRPRISAATDPTPAYGPRILRRARTRIRRRTDLAYYGGPRILCGGRPACAADGRHTAGGQTRIWHTSYFTWVRTDTAYCGGLDCADGPAYSRDRTCGGRHTAADIRIFGGRTPHIADSRGCGRTCGILYGRTSHTYWAWHTDDPAYCGHTAYCADGSDILIMGGGPAYCGVGPATVTLDGRGIVGP